MEKTWSKKALESPQSRHFDSISLGGLIGVGSFVSEAANPEKVAVLAIKPKIYFFIHPPLLGCQKHRLIP